MYFDITTFLVLAFIIVSVTYVVIIKSLFLTPQRQYFEKNDTDFEDFDESISLLESLSELEVDYKMGKMPTDDYEALKLDFQQNYLAAKQKKQSL